MPERIKERMKELNIDVKELSEHSGVGSSTIYYVLKGKTKNCSISTYRKLAKGLKCNVSDLFD